MSVLTVVLAIAAAAAEPAKVEFGYPIFIAVGPDRSIYISDQDVPAIYRIKPDGSQATIFKGSKMNRSPLNRPRGLCVDKNGDLLVCDAATMNVYRVTMEGKATPLTGKEVTLLDGRKTTMGDFVNPESVVVAEDGTIYVSDLRLRAVFKLGSDGKQQKVVDVPAPHGLALDKDGSLLVVCHAEGMLKRIHVHEKPAAADAPVKVTDVAAGRPFRFPLSVCVRADGKYIVTDNYSKALWLVGADGKSEKLVEGDPLKNPTGLAIDASGNLAIADPHQKKVFWLGDDKKFAAAAEAK